jgi:hypothetical protein
MEHRIEKARDEWINKFKNKWDVQIQKMVAEKNATTAELVRNHTVKIKALIKNRDQQIKDIRMKFSTDMAELKAKVDEKKATVENGYSHKLSQFLTANLNQSTVYDSICSYILYFRSVIFQENVIHGSKSLDCQHEELQIITFQDVTDLQCVEPYPQSCEKFTDGLVVGPFQSQQQTTKKEITQNTQFLKKNDTFQADNAKSQSFFDNAKSQSFFDNAKYKYTETGIAPSSDKLGMVYTQFTYPLIASAPPSYETILLSSNKAD